MRALHFCVFSSWSFLGLFQHSRLIPCTVRIDGSVCSYHGSKVFQRPLPALTISISTTSLEEFAILSPKSYSKWKECCQPQFQVFSEQWLFCDWWQGWQAAGVRHCKFCAVTPPGEITRLGWQCVPSLTSLWRTCLGVGWPCVAQLELLLQHPCVDPREPSAQHCKGGACSQPPWDCVASPAHILHHPSLAPPCDSEVSLFAGTVCR